MNLKELEALSFHDQEPYISELKDPTILNELSYSNCELIRCVVAENPNTASETLERLSYDAVMYVLWAVVHNPNTPPETLDRLYCDGYMWALNDVLRNPNTPQYIKDLIKFKDYLQYYEQL